jgi:hypothetical protein
LGREFISGLCPGREQYKPLSLAIGAPRPVQALDIEKGVGPFIDHAIGEMVTTWRTIHAVRSVVSFGIC